MNLFFKSYRICLIFFLLITWESGINCGIAQETSFYPTPWIQEIKLPDHYADVPNESFYLDQLGNLFLGKGNGLTVVNENRSVHIPMDGPVYVTGNGSDTVYYACKDDLGLLLKNKDGQFHIQSYKSRISRAYRKFLPSQLITANNALFMNAEHGIYYFANGRIEVFPYQRLHTKLHKLDGQLFLKVNDRGILKWTGDSFTEAAQVQSDDTLVFMQNREVDELEVSFIETINREEMLMVSPEEGLLIMDRRGNLINVLGNKHGLPDRDIRQICVCEGGELWILGPHSLHKINHPSSLDVLEMVPGNIGRIFVSTVTDHRLVLGTSHGVFVAGTLDGPNGQWTIKSVTTDTSGAFHLLDKAGNQVFAAGTGNLVAIHEDHAEILATGNYTGLHAFRKDLLVASVEEGISRHEFKEDGWKTTVIDPSLVRSHSFAKHKGAVFFICNNSAYRLSQDLEHVVPLPFHREELLFRLIPMDRELYLITDHQVYQYDGSEETFLPLARNHKARILSASDIVIPDESEGYWMVHHLGKYRSHVTHTRESEGPEEDGRSFPILQNLGEIIGLNIKDSVLYLTGMDKVSLFDLASLNQGSGGVPVRIEQTDQPGQGTSARFHLAGLEFQSTPEPVFRYRLLPEQEEWSEWNSNRGIIFDRLRPGQYNLVAQVKDLYGRVSPPAEFLFNIKAPFYRTWYAYTSYGILLLIVLFLIQKLRLLSYQRGESRVSQRMQVKLDDLTVEKEKSDKLVAEILPDRTAAQLKSKGKAKWDKYERATVLFSDIQGFTKIAEEMNPEALIDELDKFFFHFDSVVEKYNIEKIKTIGDAYMAAGGIPEKNSTNPVEVVLAALEMQTYMQQLKSSKADIWDLRIGIHTGPVIAGVVGHKKVSYDIWGDTVNTASRMESSGIPGKVNISAITYGMVKEYFLCEYRGKLPVKYKGNIDMYFVNGLRPELAVDLKGIPNKRFFIKLQLLRLGDLEEKVLGNILTDLPDSLHFHRIEYAQKVYNQSFLLCRAEEVEQEDRLLVRTAALMLYTGLTQSFNNYENRSSVIAREILPDYKYSEPQIDRVCNLVLATKQPFQPNNQLEKILIDAKMEYIGRPDYTTQIKLLFQELKEAGSNINGQQFKKQQLELLYGFEYFTTAARRLREVTSEDQMATLEEERWI